MKTLIDSVVLLTGLEKSEVLSIATKAPTYYRKYTIPKKKGGMRRIFHPAKETKLLQYATIDLLISKMPVHRAAVGFIPGLISPLKVNAERHAQNEYLLRVDFENFFPSLRPTDFFAALAAAQTSLEFDLSTADKEFLKNILFVKYPGGTVGLPVGAPSSPVVSNVVMLELDREIQAVAERYDATYTRYADDLIFSTSVRDSSPLLLNDLIELLENTAIPKVSLNNGKTCLMSRNCRRAVTGLIITPEGEISVGRKNKRMLKALLCQFKHGKITEEDAAYLQGYLAFLLDVEPAYFNCLALKYGADLVDAALKRRQAS